MRSRLNWNLEVLVFKERGKPEFPEKNLLEQGREPTTNSTHIWHQHQDLNPSHIDGRRVLSPLRHPCSTSVGENEIFRVAVLAQSVERVDCRAGGRGFDSRGRTKTQGLKITEK